MTADLEDVSARGASLRKEFSRLREKLAKQCVVKLQYDGENNAKWMTKHAAPDLQTRVGAEAKHCWWRIRCYRPEDDICRSGRRQHPGWHW